MRKLVAVSVGTDHHKFGRLVDWVVEWANKHPEVRLVVQRGSADEIPGVQCPQTMPHEELCQLFAGADVVVCHGGPSTVMDARQAGISPIVVPRDPGFSEHVDGHQLAFAEHLRRHSLAHVCDNKEDLFALIDAGISDPHEYKIDHADVSLGGVIAFGEMLDELLDTKTTVTPLQQPEPSVDTQPDVAYLPASYQQRQSS